MNPIRITTCQSLNTFDQIAQIAHLIQAELGLPVKLLDGNDWENRYEELDRGEIDIAWICSLPYAHRAHRPDPQIELLVAPIMPEDRYGGEPIYFSDIMVHRDSPFGSFEALHGRRFAINEPHSHSGYHVVRYHLAESGYTGDFFEQVVQSGAHLTSAEWIANGIVDAAAIDSTVLDWMREYRPELSAQLRAVDTIGPSPIPPLVISKSVDPTLRAEIRALLLQDPQYTFDNAPNYGKSLAMYILARKISLDISHTPSLTEQ